MGDLSQELRGELQRIGTDVQGFIGKEKERREKLESGQAEMRASHHADSRWR